MCAKTSDPSRTPYRSRGFAAVFIALLIIPVCSIAGIAIDIGRFYILRDRLLSAADAASVATAVTLSDPLFDTPAREARAAEVFAANFPGPVFGSGAPVLESTTLTAQTVRIVARVEVSPTILEVLGLASATIRVASKAEQTGAPLRVRLVE